MAAIGFFLIHDWPREAHLPHRRIDQQFALRIKMETLHSLELQLDCARIGAWRDDKVVLKLDRMP